MVPLAIFMSGKVEIEVGFDKTIGSKVIWLQQAESNNQEELSKRQT